MRRDFNNELREVIDCVAHQENVPWILIEFDADCILLEGQLDHFFHDELRLLIKWQIDEEGR